MIAGCVLIVFACIWFCNSQNSRFSGRAATIQAGDHLTRDK
jgi:hypothetical protein